jgi:hypothetical protein
MKKFWVLKGIKIAIMIAIAITVFTFVVMQLWNWLIPALFNGPNISFLQALGLLVLCKILFSGMGRGGSWKHRNNGFWRRRMEEKMSKMTPEEKERFRQRFRGCWQEERVFGKETGEKVNQDSVI